VAIRGDLTKSVHLVKNVELSCPVESGSMSDSTYYRDHWLEVEPERVAAYEEMFAWRPQMEPLLAPAQLEPGLVVVDYGCGPGLLAMELARRVVPGGHVHAVDINAPFVRRTRERAAAQGVADRVTVHQIGEDRIPRARQRDQVICKKCSSTWTTRLGRSRASARRCGPAASRT
jgi:2-polyprenyl-3-methyl-5-hydroxy-6-metoxy-1,4-benzoquinol methylase